MGMPDGTGGTRFAFEPSRQVRVLARFGQQGLHGDPAAQGHMQRLVNHAHAAPA